MNALQFITKLLQGGVQPAYDLQKEWRQVYLRTTLHTLDIRPSFNFVANGKVYASPKSDYDAIYDNYILNRYVTQHDARQQWTRLNTITGKGFIDRAIQKWASVIFSENGYQLKAQNEKTNTYLDSGNFSGFAFSDWVKETLLHLTINDPNGYVAVLRSDNLTEEEPAKPQIYVVNSGDVLHAHTDDEPFLAFKRKVDRVEQFVVIDTERTYFIDSQSGNIVYYPNNKVVQYSILGGVPITKNGLSFFESYLFYVLDLLNRWATERAHYEGSRKDGIPIRGMVSKGCDDCGGAGVINGDCGEGAENHGNPNCKETCKKCNGSGKTISINQGDTFEFSEELLIKGGGIADFVSWVNPDTRIVDQDLVIIEGLKVEIEKALFIRQTESAAQQSGEAKKIDLAAANQFISKISNRIFATAKVLLLAIVGHIEMTATPDIVFRETTTFITKDESDYINDIATFVKMGNIPKSKELEASMAISAGDNVTAKMINFFLQYAPSVYLNTAQWLEFQNAFVGSPLISLHTLLRFFGESELRKMASELGETAFLQLPMQAVFSELVKRLPKLQTEPTPFI